jgi:hypothetical protein
MSPLGFRRKKGEAAPAVDDDAEEKPARKAKPAPAARGMVVEKPKANIYTVLLILSFVAVVIGCICLYAEMSAYEFNVKAR